MISENPSLEHSSQKEAPSCPDSPKQVRKKRSASAGNNEQYIPKSFESKSVLRRSFSAGSLPEIIALTNHRRNSLSPFIADPSESTSVPLSVSVCEQAPPPEECHESEEPDEDLPLEEEICKVRRRKNRSSLHIIMKPFLAGNKPHGLIPLPQLSSCGSYPPLSIKVSGYGLHKDRIMQYKVEVEWMEMSWTCYRRFGQFAELDEHVGAILGSAFSIPFSRKKMVALKVCKGVASRSLAKKIEDKILSKRLQKLDNYMQGCSRNVDLILRGGGMKSFAFMKFISPMQLGDVKHDNFVFERLNNLAQ